MASLHIDRDTLIIDGLQHTYRIMQLSDAHMSPDSPLDSDENRQKAAHLREVWMKHGNGLPQEDNFHRLCAVGKEEAVDLFAFAGDMTDFPSIGTAAAGRALYEKAGEYLYVLGNHEGGEAHYPLYEAATGGDPAVQVKDVGELRFVGVDNASHTVSDRALQTLADVLYGDKPVIVVHHTPLDAATLRPAAVAYWQDVSYFLFGEAGMDDNAAAYARLLSQEKTRLVAVLSGHLHLAHADMLENGVMQYVSAPCLAGYGRILTIKGK